MRPIRLLFALAGAVALAGAPMQVQAQSCVAPISWGTTYAYETDYAANVSNPGSVLTLVGSVNCFSGIFSGYMPIPAGKEYTVYVYDLTSLGTTVTNVPGPNYKVHQTTYINGKVQIWEEMPSDGAFGTNPPNATAPSTFSDGTLFLDGTIDSVFVLFTLSSGGSFLGGNFDGHETGTFTGGSFVEDVGIEICQMNLTGGWNVTPGSKPAGYTANVAGKIDQADCVTQTRASSTWGRIKSLYH